MSQLSNRIDGTRENLLTALGVIFAALLTMAYIILTVNGLLPRLRERGELKERQAIAETEQARLLSLEQTFINDVEGQIEQAESVLENATSLFLTEGQAATFLESLNQSAITTGIDVVSVQALPVPQKEANTIFDVRPFHVQAVGELPRLLQFMAFLRETAVSTVAIQNFSLVEVNELGNLNFDLYIYTSPLATGAALSDLPAEPPDALIILEELTPKEENSPVVVADALVTQLDLVWAAENWPVVLGVIQQIIDLDPTFPDIREKQYGALVNYGYQLIEIGNLDEARVQFETAVVLNPLRGEAQQGLAALTDEGANATSSTYIVQRGDTLFGISQRFNITVAALRSANGIQGNNIAVGQQLQIPNSP